MFTLKLLRSASRDIGHDNGLLKLGRLPGLLDSSATSIALQSRSIHTNLSSSAVEPFELQHLNFPRVSRLNRAEFKQKVKDPLALALEKSFLAWNHISASTHYCCLGVKISPSKELLPLLGLYITQDVIANQIRVGIAKQSDHNRTRFYLDILDGKNKDSEVVVQGSSNFRGLASAITSVTRMAGLSTRDLAPGRRSARWRSQRIDEDGVELFQSLLKSIGASRLLLLKALELSTRSGAFLEELYNCVIFAASRLEEASAAKNGLELRAHPSRQSLWTSAMSILPKELGLTIDECAKNHETALAYRSRVRTPMPQHFFKSK